jgi:hypothetical protein
MSNVVIPIRTCATPPAAPANKSLAVCSALPSAALSPMLIECIGTWTAAALRLDNCPAPASDVR